MNYSSYNADCRIQTIHNLTIYWISIDISFTQSKYSKEKVDGMHIYQKL